jgi:hypothetical protein
VDLEAYRADAEAFASELTREYYLHYAGLKDAYEIESIYERHHGLFDRGSIASLRDRVSTAGRDTEEGRRLRMLLDLAVEGCLGQATKQAEAEIARREASLTIEAGGSQLGFRASAVAQANEPDADRRAEIERARLAATDQHLNDLHRELVEGQHAMARELGFDSYLALCAECKAIDLTGLHRDTRAFAERTEDSFREVLEEPLQVTLGYGFDRFGRADISRFSRAPDLDRLFAAEGLVGAFERTLSGLGIDVRAQPGVILDLEPRPSKSPRAFCAPVRVPAEVYLVLSPVGGRDDFSVLFHEGGHTEHYAHVDPGLPFEFRMLGDNTITEAFAFLFQHLVENPEWLSRQLGVEDAEPVAAHARAERMIYLRRYCAKLAYELELHASAGPLTALAGRYSELLGAGLQMDWPAQTFLGDVDPGFYCACYLRAWALEAQMRRQLKERFGPAWFASEQAGRVLRSLWSQGQRMGPDELLGELGGEQLRFGVLAEDLGV